MIGQTKLFNQFISMFENKTLPRFMLLVGDKGSGKKTLVNESLYETSFLVYEVPDMKVDTIRTMIADSYKVSVPTLYCIYDADTMSANAKNALLKVTEEPPNNAFFIMTLQDVHTTLETIRSRAEVFYMEKYTKDDLKTYIDGRINEQELGIALDLCEVPGDVDLLEAQGIQKFHDFVEKVIDNISVASSSNVFKMAQNLKLKEDSDGYDLKMFFKIFIKICRDRAVNEFSDVLNFDRYTKGIQITSNYLKELGITGISKPGLVDMWILDIRKEWMD